MKKIVLSLFAFLAIFCLANAPAQAAACVTWSCNHSTGACTFNASCSSANPYVWKYDFEWGDGSSTGLTGNSSQSHTYTSGYDATLILHVYAFSEPVSQSVSCTIWHHSLPVSPQPPSSGSCP